jgi:MtN3 and saliva related transmembrane protein
MENFEKIIEILLSFALTANAALFLPQIFILLKTKNSTGLSLLTFLGFTFIQLLGSIHSYIIRDYFPLIGWFASLCVCGGVTSIIIYYRYLYKRKKGSY